MTQHFQKINSVIRDVYDEFVHLTYTLESPLAASVEFVSGYIQSHVKWNEAPLHT
jgi:hypothetical protein